jgi:hypothetical protein
LGSVEIRIGRGWQGWRERSLGHDWERPPFGY